MPKLSSIDIEAMNRVRRELRVRLDEIGVEPQNELIALITLAITSAKRLDMDPCDLCMRIVAGLATVYGIDSVELLRQTHNCAVAERKASN